MKLGNHLREGNVGMRGNYVAFENSLLNQIINGDKDIFDIDTTQYPCLDIGESWQAIHYLLCKDNDDGKSHNSYVVPTREENELNCGFDFGVFYITAKQVKKASDYLNTLDDNTLMNLYDFNLMIEKRIYPLFGNENANEADVFYEYIYSHLANLQKYFERMAEKGYAIIFYVM